MRIKADIDAMYRTQADPWNIGAADSPRYDLYRELVLREARERSTLLEIGCGFGAFLARFHDEFDRLIGVDVSHRAIEEGARRYPFIEYHHLSATNLPETISDASRFDAIVCSDVINYLPEREKDDLLRWVASHLSPRGLAFIAAWSPGGDYLTSGELRRLLQRHFAVLEEHRLDSGHAAFLARRKRHLVAMTVDYETWHPVPEGRRIDWDVDVFRPTARLLDIGDRHGIRLTLMAEIGEFFWLRENDAAIAARMEDQWRDALRRGHDVQLHLHPNWLPELGANFVNGRWSWDWSRSTAADYPGDLTLLITRCRDALESVLRSVDPDYKVSCFRAGSYEAQPFERLHDALLANGIEYDSSVYAGHRHDDRHYDYSLAYSGQLPYFASRLDPQLRAPPAEQRLIELPPFIHEPGVYWTFDGSFGPRFADLLLRQVDAQAAGASTESYRRTAALRRALARIYLATHRRIDVINWILPRALAHGLVDYEPERLVEHEYYVLVGHSKGDLAFEQIEIGMARLAADPRLEFVGLSQMARLARVELERPRSNWHRDSAPAHASSPPSALRDLVPLDRRRIVELVGSGTAASSLGLDRAYPWMSVSTVQVDSELSIVTIEREADCVCAYHVLELAVDPTQALADLYAALGDGGLLVAAVRSDARNPHRINRRHRWKSVPHDMTARLAAAGFVDIEVTELDAFRHPGAMPYPPSRDRTMYVRAWKRAARCSQLDRIDELCRFTYDALTPERPVVSHDPAVILAQGTGWCLDYAVVLGEALRREGFRVRWVSMLAEGHPRGRGERKIDTHEVIELELSDGSLSVVDPMANVRFPSSLAELLRNPTLADIDRVRDERYQSRGYDLYATSFWYSRVRKVDLRLSPRDPPRLLPVRRVTHPGRWGEALWAPRRRPVRRLARGALARLRATYARGSPR